MKCQKKFLYQLFKLFNLYSIRLVVFQIVFLKITLKTTNNSMPFFQCALLLSNILPPCSWSCLTRCSPVDCSPLGSSLHGIFQARILEWVACPPPWNLPNSGIEPRSPTLWADSLRAKPQGKPWSTGVPSPGGSSRSRK